MVESEAPMLRMLTTHHGDTFCNLCDIASLLALSTTCRWFFDVTKEATDCRLQRSVQIGGCVDTNADDFHDWFPYNSNHGPYAITDTNQIASLRRPRSVRVYVFLDQPRYYGICAKEFLEKLPEDISCVKSFTYSFVRLREGCEVPTMFTDEECEDALSRYTHKLRSITYLETNKGLWLTMTLLYFMTNLKSLVMEENWSQMLLHPFSRDNLLQWASKVSLVDAHLPSIKDQIDLDWVSPSRLRALRIHRWQPGIVLRHYPRLEKLTANGNACIFGDMPLLKTCNFTCSLMDPYLPRLPAGLENLNILIRDSDLNPINDENYACEICSDDTIDFGNDDDGNYAKDLYMTGMPNRQRKMTINLTLLLDHLPKNLKRLRIDCSPFTTPIFPTDESNINKIPRNSLSLLRTWTTYDVTDEHGNKNDTRALLRVRQHRARCLAG